MLNIETLIDDLIDFMRAGYPTALQQVLDDLPAAKKHLKIGVTPPPAENYFFGEPSRFRRYRAPSVFLAPSSSRHPGEGGGSTFNTVDMLEHRILCVVLVEGISEEALTRACFRHAEAVDRMLRDREITPSAVTSRATKVFIPNIDYGVIWVPRDGAERPFRRDVSVELAIRHYDLFT